MYQWNTETAISELEKVGYKPTNQRKEKSKSAGFAVDPGEKRHIAVSCSTQNVVTCYLNRTSVSGTDYPALGISGVEVKQEYRKGHASKNGNPGIAGSVVRYNKSLDPSAFSVMRVHVESSDSLKNLLEWYTE